MSIESSVTTVSGSAQLIEAASNELVTNEVATSEVAVTEVTSQDVVSADAVTSETTSSEVINEAATTSPASSPAPGSSKKRKKNKKQRKAAQSNQAQLAPVNPSTPVDSAKSQPKANRKPAPVLVESGQVHMGKVNGFVLGADKQTRMGVVLWFKGGDSAFMHVSQVGSYAPQERLDRLMRGDMVRVIVTVKPSEGKRRVRASEKALYFADTVKALQGGLAGVTGEVTKKLSVGALLKITTPGEAFGLVGLLLFKNIPGGQRALDGLVVGQSMQVDIVRARIDEEKDSLKLTLDAFGAQRREIENRFPVGISVNGTITNEVGDSYLLRLKSGEPCRLPKAALNGFNPEAVRAGRSLSAFVTGVDARGVILLSKVMPE
jgi:ribosomal protein S1